MLSFKHFEFDIHNYLSYKISVKVIKMTEKSITRKIEVTDENRKFLIKTFKVTNQTIYNSLDLMKPGVGMRERIRKLALERGGRIMVTLPEDETFHDSDNVMRQYMPNGAIIELSKTDGTACIYFKGREIKRYENVKVSAISRIQAQAEALR